MIRKMLSLAWEAAKEEVRSSKGSGSHERFTRRWRA